MDDDERAQPAETKVNPAGLSFALRTHVLYALQRILLHAGRDDETLAAMSPALGAATLRVADVANAAGMAEVGSVARGVSALAEHWLNGGAVRADALRVHLDALGVLARRDDEAKVGWQVVSGLEALRAALGVSE